MLRFKYLHTGCEHIAQAPVFPYPFGYVALGLITSSTPTYTATITDLSANMTPQNLDWYEYPDAE